MCELNESRINLLHPAPQILVVEDQPREREALARLLRLEGFHVITAKNITEASVFAENAVDLVISDLRLGNENAIELLKLWVAHRPEVPFVVVTAYGDVESAVAAMKLGAVDYLSKPLKPSELLHLLKSQLGIHRTVQPAPATSLVEEISQLLGQSAAIQDVFHRIRRVTAPNRAILLTGEPGTGKKLTAAIIHRLSHRRMGPHVSVDLSAVPDGLIEAELFGVASEAFTNVTSNRLGRFDEANGGTLLLENVEHVPPALQTKLLRVLDSLLIRPVGGDHDHRVDVRVIASTSRNLSELAAAGLFRDDLFRRLSMVTIPLPPLRERREDIPVLIERLLKESACRNQRTSPRLVPELVQFLTEHDWPGNVQQLRDIVENMVITCRGAELSLADLPEILESGSAIPAFGLAKDESLQGLERVAILSALDRFFGNRTRTAEALGISVRTLQRKIKLWGLANPDARLEEESSAADDDAQAT